MEIRIGQCQKNAMGSLLEDWVRSIREKGMGQYTAKMREMG
jgi:hypothetical protein